MNHLIRRRFSTIVFVAFFALSACGGNQPPSLTPEAKIAYTAHEVGKALDVIRDMAQDANAQTPPLVSTNATRTITEWHKSAVAVMLAAPSGWKATVQASLVEVQRNLPAADGQRLKPYFALAQTLLNEVK